MTIQPNIRTKDTFNFKFNVDKWSGVGVLCRDNVDEIELYELKYYVTSRAA